MSTVDSSMTSKRFRVRSVRRLRAQESLILVALVLCALVSVLVSFTILWILLRESGTFFTQPDVSLREFLTGTAWEPTLGNSPRFGIWPLICGSLLVTAIAMLLAIPMGLITAIYMSEYAPRSVRAVLKPTLEILAGIPTIVYGFLALRLITPGLIAGHSSFLAWTGMDGINIYNAFSAGIAVGILCFPTVCTLSEDAIRAVPRHLREGAFALGGTPFDVIVKVVIPSAFSGIISAIVLATGRAVGETMIVALAAGSIAKLTLDPRDQVQTLTGHMVSMATGNVAYESPQYGSMYAVAIVLVLLTLSMTWIGSAARRKFREKYA